MNSSWDFNNNLSILSWPKQINKINTKKTMIILYNNPPPPFPHTDIHFNLENNFFFCSKPIDFLYTESVWFWDTFKYTYINYITHIIIIIIILSSLIFPSLNFPHQSSTFISSSTYTFYNGSRRRKLKLSHLAVCVCVYKVCIVNENYIENMYRLAHHHYHHLYFSLTVFPKKKKIMKKFSVVFGSWI